MWSFLQKGSPSYWEVVLYDEETGPSVLLWAGSSDRRASQSSTPRGAWWREASLLSKASWSPARLDSLCWANSLWVCCPAWLSSWLGLTVLVPTLYCCLSLSLPFILPLFLSHPLSIYSCVSLCMSLTMFLSHSESLLLWVSVSLSVCLCVSFHLCISVVSLWACLPLFRSFSLCISFYFCVCCWVCLFLFVYLCPCVSLSFILCLSGMCFPLPLSASLSIFPLSSFPSYPLCKTHPL